MTRIFLRSYQQNAIEQIVGIFTTLGSAGQQSNRRRQQSVAKFDAKNRIGTKKPEEISPGDLLEHLKQRVTIVCAPTASGKTLVMKGISDRLAELGFVTLVLTYASPVAAQNRAAGLAASTIQKFFRAFEAAEAKELELREARRFVAKHIDLPEEFLDEDLAVLVDESHLGLENMAQIYDKVLRFLINARMIVGFTATPRWREYFNLIDLSKEVAKHVAAPRGSIIHTEWLGSLPQQALIFPKPMLIFSRSVLSAAILTMAFRLSGNGFRSGLVVANGKKAVEELVLRFLLRESGRRGSDDDQDDDELGLVLRPNPSLKPLGRNSVSMAGYQRAEAFHVINHSNIKVDLMERRFGMIVMLLLLDVWSQMPSAVGAAALQRFGIVHGQIPRFALAMRLLRQHLPATANDVLLAIDSADYAAAMRVARRAAAVHVLQGVSPSEFVRREIDIGISVYKIATGFNLPELRTILFAETVVGSLVLYEQRAGRGARKIAGKDFYDLVEAHYLDPYSDAAINSRGISWRTLFLRDPSVRRILAHSDLIFRYPCASWEVDEEA